MTEASSFFRFQERVGRALLAWGVGSIAAGLAGVPSRNRVVRHAGLQSIAWGAIDAALGLCSRRGASRQIAAGAADAATHARRFRAIVLVNTVLDVGYLAGGWALVRSARGRADRAGAGLGIMAQGLFLLLFDAALTWLSGRWVREPI
jgi:hypothetical protein